jgi:predicted NBD/HSP70 family sugar kinase
MRTSKGGSATGKPGVGAGTPSLLRAINERAILELISQDGPVSRAHLAAHSGLSKPTVGLALTALVRAGLVHEVGRSTGRRGPRAALYELNPRASWVAGIDIGREWVRAAIADLTGSIVARRDERAQVHSAQRLIKQIGALAHGLAAETGVEWRQVTQVTVGSPGVFDPERGQVALAPNIPGWSRHGLVDIVRAELGTNVTFENDVNLAALGEQWHGLGRGIRDFAYLWVGTGVGLGLVLDGKLYRGAGGRAGEIGYLPLGVDDPRDPVYQRRGAFEEGTAATGVVRVARELGMRAPTSGERVFDAARRGDTVALSTVQIEAARIALGIAAILAVVDPELVILGGGIGRNGDLLLEAIEREVASLVPFRTRVAVSALGQDAVLHGAVATALTAARDGLFWRPNVRRAGEALAPQEAMTRQGR